MGHVRNYTIGDVIARFKYLKGFNVLHPMGWDAFGPQLKMHQNKIIYTQVNGLIKIFKHEKTIKIVRFIDRLGSRNIDLRGKILQTPTELFIDFTIMVSIQKETYVNWDPVEKTVLANEQVINGRGWRSNAIVERKKLSQWFFNITKFAEPLLNDLENLTGWPEK